MKKVYIISLHLAFGGIEKAICQMANMFCERYDTEIICVYDMPGGPAFPLDKRVKVRYLLKDIPNREQWKAALRDRNPGEFIRESARAARILAEKKQAVINAVKGISDGVIITTRHEDNLVLSRYGAPGVLKIAQLHHDHRFDRSIVHGFRTGYGNIDILCMLTPSLRDETVEMMDGRNSHTRVEFVPNFLEHYPAAPFDRKREKTVVAAGRLNSVKRFDLLIEDFMAVSHELPGWTLRILGEGEERAHLENVIRENNGEGRVILTGMKDPAGVEEEMLRASVYAMSSETEGFPFVLLECESCGLPMVAYDVRVGPGFVIKTGENGILVPEGDRQGYRDALKKLARDSELREYMGRNAVRHASEFSRDKVAQIWYSLIGD